MLKESQLESKHTDEEYTEHIDKFNDNPDEVQERYIKWVESNVADLKRIYCRRVWDEDSMAIHLGFADWSQQMFIAWDYNQNKEQALKNEMKQMMGEV